MEKLLHLYKYVDGTNDTPFPSKEQQAILFEFKYDAKRMGNAPTITGTLMHPLCLDELWGDGMVYVTYNSERYFLKQTPTSSYSNEDTRYKHEVDFVSERIALSNVYFYDVVTGDTTNDKPVSNSSNVTFYGDIHEFAQRLNYSLQYAKLGYSVVVDSGIASETMLVTFQDQFIANVLQEVYNTYKIPYYFVGKVIHIGYTNSIIETPFKYGVNNALLSVSKDNVTQKIINRITGIGSSDNIPYYYPNLDPKGVSEALLNSASSDKISISNTNRYKKVKLGDKFTYISKGDETLEYIDKSKYIVSDGPYQTSENYENVKTFELVLDFPFDVDIYRDTTIVLDYSKGNLSNFKARLYRNVELWSTFSSFGSTPFYRLYEGSYNFSISLEFTFNEWDEKQEITLDDIPNIVDALEVSIYANVEGENKWVLNDLNKSVELNDYGLVFNGTPKNGDTISFKQISYITPQPNLMPPIYRESMGNERFYNATNNTYIDPISDEYYTFDNPFVEGKRKEHKENFEDIKPSIKGVVNDAGLRIDMFSEFAYDANDNDEFDEEGNYIHPYFFAKLRKFDGDFGFNLFEHAIEEDEMVISMTSGSCGACNFIIGVDNETQKNIVQVDENGKLKRDANGNVMYGMPQDRQNDTSKYEVWIALKKDIETFGVVMPNASNNYKPSTTDTFVILHIDLPQAYVYAAENSLKEEIINFMANNNSEKFTFSINFSRIFFALNPTVFAQLNENSFIKVQYNNIVYSLFVSSYSYSINESNPLPEIRVDLAQGLEIKRESITKQLENASKSLNSEVQKVSADIAATNITINKKTQSATESITILNSRIDNIEKVLKNVQTQGGGGSGEGGITQVTAQMIEEALGYVPYSSKNPSGYITSAALADYATEQWVKQQGYLTQHQDLSAYAKSADIANTYATKVALQTLQNEHNALSTKVTNLDTLLNSDVSGVINTWGEVVDFLDEYSGSEDLATILAGMNNDIANRVLIEDFEKLEDSVSGIAGYFTNGSANNALKLGGQLPSYYATKSALDTTNGNVVSLTQRMGTAESGISTNKTNIASLTTDLSNLTGRVSTAEETIKEHTDAIALNANNIAANIKSIATNATAITAVSNRVQRFEDVIGIDSNGDVYIKGMRNFYTERGTIGMAGLGSGGSGGGGGTAGLGSVTVRVNGQDYITDASGIVTIPDYPTSLPASDVYAWAKAATKPTYTASEVGALSTSGGTITISSYQGITIKRAAANATPLLWFSNNNGNLGAIGFNANKEVVIDNTSTEYTLIHSGNYTDYALSKSGGTISSSGFAPLNIKRDSTTGTAAIAYSGQSVTYGTLGFNDVTGPKWFDMSYNEYTLIHSGNIGDYTLFKKDITKLIPSDNLNDYTSGYFGWRDAKTPINGVGSNTAVLAFKNERGLESFQLEFDANGEASIRFRKQNTSQVWTSWKNVAFTDSNVASADYATNAGNAEKVAGFPITSGTNKPWNSIPAITVGGYMDVGKHFEFHYDNTTGSDFSTILGCTGNYGNIVNLPSASGTLALLTDNVASADYARVASALKAVSSTYDYVNGIERTSGFYDWSQSVNGGYFYGLQMESPDANYKMQVARMLWSAGLFWRECNGSSTYGDWVTIVDGNNISLYNAGSATKLQTARTIWGQSFDGTGNVSGVLSDVNQVTFDANKSYGIFRGDWIHSNLQREDLGYYAPKHFFLGNILVNTAIDSGYKLDVNGTAYFGQYIAIANNNGVYFKDASGTIRSQLYVDPSNNTTIGYGAMETGGNTLVYGDSIRFLTSSANEAMRITKSGQIGILTTEPFATVEVAGGFVNPYSTCVASSAQISLGQHANDGMFLGYGTIGGWIQSSYYGTSENPSANHTYPIVLNPLGGNVLIGTTTNSGYKLAVNGSLNATNIYQNGQTLDKYYLPLSGGTIEGDANALKIKRNGSYLSCIEFVNTDGSLGSLGFVWSNNPAFFHTDGNYYPLIHSGNIGSQSVASATKLQDSNGVLIYNNGSTFYIGDTIYPTVETHILGKEIVLRYSANATYGLTLKENGNVLIGTAEDNGYKLQINGGITTYGTINMQSVGGIQNALAISCYDNGTGYYVGSRNSGLGVTDGGALIYAYGATPISLYTNGSERVRISGGGNVIINSNTRFYGGSIFMNDLREGIYIHGTGINYHNSSNAWVASCLSFDYYGNTTLYHNLTVTGDITSEGTMAMAKLASSSDRKLKNNIAEVSAEQSLSIIRQLRPTTWNWIKDGKKSYGFIAQEVEPIVPEMVVDMGHLHLEYNQLHAFEIGAIKHIDSEVEILKRDLEIANGRIEVLENELKQYRRNA